MQLGVVEERNRLAREIHDTLAQGLSAIALQLETADAFLEGIVPDESPNAPRLSQVQQAIQKALALARDNLVEARHSVLDLRAAPLEGSTLAEALSKLVQSVSHTVGVPISFLLEGDTRPLPIHVEVGLYRIAQEALNNIARHAAAHQAAVRLRILPTQIELTIQDDGCGFDPNEIPDARFGLVGLAERVKLLDGTLQIESSPNEGTQVTVGVVA
jgi:two-component system NarL family sensor kinase